MLKMADFGVVLGTRIVLAGIQGPCNNRMTQIKSVELSLNMKFLSLNTYAPLLFSTALCLLLMSGVGFLIYDGSRGEPEAQASTESKTSNAHLESEPTMLVATSREFPAKVIIDKSGSLPVVEREVITGDPFLQVFVDSLGKTTREIRKDQNGNAYLETRYVEDQILTLQRTFDSNGSPISERQLINGKLKEEHVFR